ncbi:MAG: radical SAM protein [Nanoarchaeota archaeon]|nr:radical SAM protein [Nanoarchaeota archaeon]
MENNPFGELIGQIRGRDFYDAPLHYLVAKGKDAELCYIHGKDLDKEQDPQYWLIEKTSKGIRRTVIGRTGIVQTVEVLDKQGNARRILHRSNGYGNFEVDGENTVEGLLHQAYGVIDGLDFSQGYEKRRELFSWRAQHVIARFGEIRKLYGENDIVPEYNDTMIVAKISDSCPRHCIYCPEPSEKGIVLFDKRLINHNITMSRRLHEKYHGTWISEMDEGFLNTSDILWFHLADRYANDRKWRETLIRTDPVLAQMMKRVNLKDGSGNITALDDIVDGKSKKHIPDPIEIIDSFNGQFTQIKKMYTFMGVPTINATSPEYLREMYDNGKRFNRILVGIESADDITSRFLGKNETYKDKADAVKKLHEAGFKVKAIVQVGVTGESFRPNGTRYHRSRTALLKTADWLEAAMRKRIRDRGDKVQVSKYIPVEGTALKRLHEEAIRIRPFKDPSLLDKEVEWFVEELIRRGLDAEADYEIAIQNGK